MTGERLCAVCGVSVYYAKPFSGGWAHDSFAPIPDDGHDPVVEAAPSTDEGEERWERYVTTDKGTLWRSGATLSANVPAGVEAAIRAPLEERIRELEVHGSALAAVDGERIEYLEAEVERLREALRDTASHLNMASLVVDTALLPSPPSSTEGTE